MTLPEIEEGEKNEISETDIEDEKVIYEENAEMFFSSGDNNIEEMTQEQKKYAAGEMVTEVEYGTVIASGECGGDLIYEVIDEDGDGNEELLVISGTGAMQDYSCELVNGEIITMAPWGKYYISRLILNEGITHIGKYAFSGCRKLTGDLVIPEGVTSIGRNAFSDCSGLTGNLIIPEGVTSIGRNAFSGCSGLTGNLVIPEEVTVIEERVFSDCRGLTGDLILPENVTSIGRDAFYHCSSLNGELKIPEGIVAIGPSAFSGCSGLIGDLIIPESVTNIGVRAFENCRGLTGKLKIPEGITVIENGVFSGCRGLTGDLIIPESVTSIESHAFADCRGLTGDLIIPENVTSIGLYAFKECIGIGGELKIPEGITVIESGVFSGCRGLTGNLIIPESVVNIDLYAFFECYNLEKITILNEICKIYDDQSMIPRDCVIAGYANSTAQKYAEKYGTVFEMLPCKVHTWDKEYTIDKDASCTEDGIKTVHCMICDMTKDTVKLDKLGHVKVVDGAVEATCAKDGLTEGSHCSVCGEILVIQNSVEATGHNFGKWITVKEPTASETGLQKRVCAICNEDETAEIARKDITPPTLVSAEATAYDKIKFTWKPVSGVAGYRIYRKTSDGNWEKMDDVTSSVTGYTDKKVTAGIKYTYTVKAFVLIDGKIVLGKCYINGKSAVTRPEAPKLVGAEGTAYNKIKVTWKTVNNTLGYRIYRKTSGGNWVYIKEIADPKATTFTDTGVKSGVKYTYTVKSYVKYNGKKLLGYCYSAGKSAVTRPEAPKLVSAESTAHNKIKVTWKTVNNTLGYRIYRKTSGGNWVYIKEIADPKATSFIDTGVKAGVKYTYTVKSYVKYNGKKLLGYCYSAGKSAVAK